MNTEHPRDWTIGRCAGCHAEVVLSRGGYRLARGVLICNTCFATPPTFGATAEADASDMDMLERCNDCGRTLPPSGGCPSTEGAG